MAELSRVRGADTEEQLLELQRAFLASSDHRANAAARVQRVGGAPPRPPTEDETAGQLPESIRAEASARGGAPGTYTTASFDDGRMDEDPAPQPELRDMVREVVERPVGRAPPAPPGPPVGGTGLPFPAATHRTKGPFAGRKSKFMAEREARRAAAAASGAASSSLDDVAPAGSVRVGGANVSFQMMPPPTSGAPGSSAAAASAASGSRPRPAAPTDESAGVEEETARRLAAMSVQEIEEARATLAARLKPESLAFLRARGERKAAAAGTAAGTGPGAGAGAGAETGTGTVTGPASVSPSMSTAVPAGDETSPPGSSPSGPSGASPPTSPPRGRPSSKRASSSPVSSLSSLSGKTASLRSSAAARARAAAAAANSMASAPTPTEVSAVRYTLDGAPLNADDLPAAQRAASRLGSATERDPLRAGHQGARDGPGYTLGEALDLARSSVPAQRVAGLGLVAKVLTQARRWGGGGGPRDAPPAPPPAGGPVGAGAPRRRSVGMAGLYGAAGAPSNPLSLPPPLPAGVAWGDVWLHALVDHNAVFLLRRAMDDAHLPAASAAAAATAALLGASRGAGVSTSASGLGGGGTRDAVEAYCATDWYDALECAPPAETPMTSFTVPLWRSGGWGATFAPLTWEAASGPLAINDDGTVKHDPADEEEPEAEDGGGSGAETGGGGMSAERRKSRGMAHAADPVAAMLRMGLLPRLRYLLEVGRHPAAIAPALDILAAAARHSPDAATAVARCPRLIPVLVAVATQGVGGAGAGAGAEANAASGSGDPTLSTPSSLSSPSSSSSYPPGSAAAATRVLRVVAASAPEHARRMGADGIPSAVVQSAAAACGGFGAWSSSGTGATRPKPSSAASAGWIEALRLWSVVAAGDGAVPSVDGLYPVIARVIEPPGSGLRPLDAAAAAATAAEAFGLLAALARRLPRRTREKFASREGWVPPDAARTTDEVEGHASTALTMSDGTSPLSWSCATGAAAAAEAWVTAPPPQPPEQHAAPPSGYSAAAWRASGAAAHFLANLIAASVVGGETEASAAATRAGRRALGLDGGLDAEPGGTTKIQSDAVGALEPEDGLAAAALDALGSGSNDGTDGELAGRAAFGVALHGALRLAAVVPGASSEPLAARLAGRVVRQLTIAAGVAAAANALDDGVVRGGRAPLVSAAELPAQRALVVALEMQESGAEAGEAAAEDAYAEGAVSAVEAAAAVARALPPGAGGCARDAISAGLLSRRALGPLLRTASAAVSAAAKGSGVVPERRVGAGTGFGTTAAGDLELGVADPGTLVPTVDAARAALLGGFALDLLSDDERAAASAGADAPAAPLRGVGSTMPLPPITHWLLAPCSPKSTVAGWGPEGAAASLAILLALESSGSLVTRDLPAEAKLTSVSGIFCLGEAAWRDPAVSAAAAALTDIYWGRLEEEKSSNSANPRMGIHAYGWGNHGAGDDQQGAIATAAAGLAEALCEAFANDSFGDKLFARHVAFLLRAGAPARARVAAWLALREGVAFHLLPPLPALAPRPDRGDALLFLPPGGEPDGEMTELYLQALESGALDRCLADAEARDEAPPLPAALALHAATHAVLKNTRAEGAAATIRRLMRRPGTRGVLRGVLRTPLTQRRRPAVARAAAAGARGGTRGGGASVRWGGQTPFGPGAAYGIDPPSADVEARRSVLLAVCEDDADLRKELRAALEDAVPYPPDSDDE